MKQAPKLCLTKEKDRPGAIPEPDTFSLYVGPLEICMGRNERMLDSIELEVVS